MAPEWFPSKEGKDAHQHHLKGGRLFKKRAKRNHRSLKGGGCPGPGRFSIRGAKGEEALSLIKGCELYAPPLHELTSIARKKALSHPELLGKTKAALEIGLALDIRWTEVDHLAVLEFALEKGLTTYDAS